jgi:hypothetical protein
MLDRHSSPPARLDTKKSNPSISPGSSAFAVFVESMTLASSVTCAKNIAHPSGRASHASRAPERLGKPCAPGVRWRDEDVVGHQHLCMQHALLALQCIPQTSQKGVTSLLVVETGTAVVATLHDTQPHAVKMDLAASGHVQGFAELNLIPFPRPLSLWR